MATRHERRIAQIKQRRGRVISRETTTGNTTTIYDARGGMSDGSRRSR